MEIIILGIIIYLVFKYPVNAAKVIGYFFLFLLLGIVGFALLWIGFIFLLGMLA